MVCLACMFNAFLWLCMGVVCLFLACLFIDIHECVFGHVLVFILEIPGIFPM